MSEIIFPNKEIEIFIQPALKEANELGHSWIGSEHILLTYFEEE